VDRGASARLTAWIGLAVLALATTPGSAAASSAGVSLLGSAVPSATTDTGLRERVELSARADLLVGRTERGAIDSVIVWAPGVGAGHVIVREIAGADGTTSLLLTAPPALIAHVRRATLLLRPADRDRTLWERDGTRWVRREGQAITIGASAQRAFSVAGLGAYWLTPHDVDLAGPTSSPPALLGGRLGVALSAWVWPALALGLVGLLARSIHRLEAGE
jgi:hypothetical protein